MTRDELARFFEEPGAHLLLDINLTVIDAGPEYLRTTYTKREDIVGRSVLDLVDDSTHKEYNGSLRQSLARAIETRAPDKMPVQQYDILRRTGRGEQTEHSRRWLKVTNIPVFNNGEITGIVQRIEDVTLEYETAGRVTALRRSNYILYGVVVLLLGIALAAFGHENSLLKAQAHRSCLIQKRGLPAGHELAASMADIHKLLTAPPTTPAQRVRAAQTPQPVLQIVADLNRHLARYQNLEARQPQSRRC